MEPTRTDAGVQPCAPFRATPELACPALRFATHLSQLKMSAAGADYEHAVGRVRTGLLNWNKGTTGASGKLPFGGEKRSGNARPAGVTSTLYTTYPQAHLEAEPNFDASSLPPGMPRP